MFDHRQEIFYERFFMSSCFKLFNVELSKTPFLLSGSVKKEFGIQMNKNSIVFYKKKELVCANKFLFVKVIRKFYS